MANQQNQNAGDDLGFSSKQIAALKLIIEEMKKPYVDEEAVARKEKARESLRAERAEAERRTKARQDSCSHLRDDNTSRVAWIQLYHVAKKLYVREGYCQQCNKHFAPGVEGYEAMLRIPVGKSGIVG